MGDTTLERLEGIRNPSTEQPAPQNPQIDCRGYKPSGQQGSNCTFIYGNGQCSNETMVSLHQGSYKCRHL
jgi:hypothetical protein